MLRHLVFSHVPCSSSGPAACAAFPAAGSLGVFRSPGVCPSASLVTWVELQPFPSFSMLLLRFLAGVGGVMHPVSGCSRCGGVFVVRHDLGFVDTYSGRWMVQVPAVFLNLTLGSSISLPVLAAGLRWLRFILGCPPSVALLWRGLTWFFIRCWLACPHGAAVPLDSWDRSPISGPSVFFLSPRP